MEGGVDFACRALVIHFRGGTWTRIVAKVGLPTPLTVIPGDVVLLKREIRVDNW